MNAEKSNPEIPIKLCVKCKVEKPITEFYKAKESKFGVHSYCKLCHNEHNRIKNGYNERVYVEIKDGKKVCSMCKEIKPIEEFCISNSARFGLSSPCKQCQSDKRLELRFDILNHYSNGDLKCACCGENESDFLTLDHIDGGGRQHRKKVGSGNIYVQIRREGYPKGYRVLCMNCNFCYGIKGYCPHQRNKENQS